MSFDFIKTACRVSLKNLPHLVPDVSEHLQPFFFIPLRLGRVEKRPVMTVQLPGKDRASLICVITNGNYGFHVRAEKVGERFGTAVGDVDARLSHDFHGERMDEAGGLGTCASNEKFVAASHPKKTFSHVTPAGVAGAENQDGGFVRGHHEAVGKLR